MSMQAVILAAGEGSRMRPLTHNRPKVMLPLAGKPMLEHMIIEMQKAGVTECILVTGYKEEVIREYFGDGSNWGLKISYCTQPEQRGTADAVRMVEKEIEGKFLVTNGDIIKDHRDITAICSGENTTMGVFEVEDTRRFGVIDLDGDRVTRVLEKVENPPTNLANAALYLFTPEIFEAIAETPVSERGEYEITKSLQILIEKGKRVTYKKVKKWVDVSYPWELLEATETLLAGMKAEVEGEIEDNVTIKGEVSVGKGSIVRSGSYIIGPVLIGENCDIGPNCYIRPTTTIGNGCHIGAAVEVKNSIIMNGSKVPHHNYVGDSVIGEGCNLGSGTKVANLKLDKKEVSVGGISTGRRKLGVIMGDGVQTGINACINVGTVIGSNTLIGPGTLASGIIEAGSKVFQINRPVNRRGRSEQV